MQCTSILLAMRLIPSFLSGVTPVFSHLLLSTKLRLSSPFGATLEQVSIESIQRVIVNKMYTTHKNAIVTLTVI